MAPKLGCDKDGDIPPCSVMDDFKAVEKWERYKQAKYEFKERKAPCGCQYFDGDIPSDHKCFIPINYSFWKKITYWVRNKLRAFRT
jgi:hypothetical protein